MIPGNWTALDRDEPEPDIRLEDLRQRANWLIDRFSKDADPAPSLAEARDWLLILAEDYLEALDWLENSQVQLQALAGGESTDANL